MTPLNSEVRYLPAESRDLLDSAMSGLVYGALDAIPDAIMIVDLNHRVVRVNRTMARWLGIEPEEAPGRFYSNLLHGQDLPPPGCPYARLLIDGQKHAAELTLERLGGDCVLTASPIHCDDGKGVGSLLVARSVPGREWGRPEHSGPETQLPDSRNPESLGVLAGGIAHDFNNLLTTIQGNAELARMDLPDDSPVCENISEIDSSSTRAAEICQQMLDYAGKGKLTVEPLDVSVVVKGMCRGLEAGVGDNIAFDYGLPEGLPGVAADPIQLRRLVQSLVTNAREAIDGEAGVVTIRTGTLSCGRFCRADARFGHEMVEGPCVFLEISDTGCGMDQKTLNSLCDPYFSTKFAGRGLSLSAALGIIRGHGGALRVWSEEGRGSTFLVLFPFLRSEEQDAGDRGETELDSWRGSGTVLIVDDEKPVRTVGRRMLERMGFNVLVAIDGREAVEIYRTNAERIDCVLLDLTMPEMDGEEAFREIRRIRKDALVILASGYSEEDVLCRFRGEGLAGFLHKPYRYKLLRSMVRKVLDD